MKDIYGETVYLVCDDCGEAFDSIETAYGHMHDSMIDPRWALLPESEAM
jgi:hypothetical protein